MDQGEESIEDEALRTQLRRQARWITLRAVAVAAALTAVAVALP
jgi:hypothetical protein